ncbi:RHS repeat-associated core domain-containing protein [Colwellia polaris]|uniref:hypothetical protein n=1 Tax=Colwellia polaris TaxID=326537 RepID=UPI0011785EFB|nr:hypothetical protein [Colwellia polaris]
MSLLNLMNSQSYNRYSYVLNNPLSMTDPSGFFFKSLLRKIASIPILNAVVTVVLAVYCQACLVAYSAMSTYAVTGSLKSAFTAGIAAAIMPGGGSVGNVVASAVIGGISSKLQGGKFGHGFWAAGIGAAMGGATRGIKSAIGKTLVATAVGGTISKITGGKFANGAYSAAFAAALSAGLNSGKVNAKDAAYAELSESIYDDGNGAQVGDTVAGYELKEIIAEENGLRAGLFVDQGGNNVVAFAGTDTSSFSGFLTDMKANLLQGLGLDSAQYSSAIGLAGRMNTRFGGNVHFTGHSLGGGLASAAAIVTGGSATVFNAAGIRNSTIGSFSRNNGSITHYYSGYDGIRAINAFSGASVPGTQINLGHAGPHTMPNVCAAMGTSC